MALDKQKQKMAIVVALGAVVVGVGAFQFLNMSSAPAPKSEKHQVKKPDAEEAAHDSEQQALRNLVTGLLPQRDPFEESPLPKNEARPPSTSPNGEKAPEPRPIIATRGIHRAERLNRISPMDPLIGKLPGTRDGVAPDKVAIQSGKPLRNPGEFGFAVVGVIVGRRPAAVFQDDSGNQRMVPLGAAVDGDSRVLDIQHGKVTVQHRGKRLTLVLGGAPGAK